MSQTVSGHESTDDADLLRDERLRKGRETQRNDYIVFLLSRHCDVKTMRFGKHLFAWPGIASLVT